MSRSSIPVWPQDLPLSAATPGTCCGSRGPRRPELGGSCCGWKTRSAPRGPRQGRRGSAPGPLLVEAGRMAAERGRHRPHCSLGLLCFQRLCPQPRRHGDLLFHPICPLQDKKVVVIVIRHALSPWINFWAGSRANIPCQRANRRVYNAVPTEESTGMHG